MGGRRDDEGIALIRASKARPEDAFELQLREEDSKEVSNGWREGLAVAILTGEGVAYRDELGTLVALFGVTAFEQEVSPWLLCSPIVQRHQATVWRRAKHLVKQLKQTAAGRLVFNYIPKDSHRNRAFVLALGFRILPSPRDGFDLFYLPHV